MRSTSLSSLWRLAPLHVALLAACNTTTVVPATEVLVRVRVDATTYAQTATLAIAVEGSADGVVIDRFAYLRSTISVPRPGEELRVALTPLDGDATRFYRVTATALDSAGVPVSVARVISGYRLGATLEYELFLVGSCLNVVCTEVSTCRGADGLCVDARVPVTDLPPFRPDAGPIDLGIPVDLGSRDDEDAGPGGFDSGPAGFDAGPTWTDLGPPDAGTADAGTADAGPCTCSRPGDFCSVDGCVFVGTGICTRDGDCPAPYACMPTPGGPGATGCVCGDQPFCGVECTSVAQCGDPRYPSCLMGHCV